jgi:hypothetical protein
LKTVREEERHLRGAEEERLWSGYKKATTRRTMILMEVCK